MQFDDELPKIMHKLIILPPDKGDITFSNNKRNNNKGKRSSLLNFPRAASLYFITSQCCSIEQKNFCFIIIAPKKKK